MKALTSFLPFSLGLAICSGIIIDTIAIDPLNPYIVNNNVIPAVIPEGIFGFDNHFKIYAQYVDQVNTLVTALRDEGTKEFSNSILIDGIRNAFSSPFNGMILHEFYFANLGQPTDSSKTPGNRLTDVLNRDFGNFDDWQTDFITGAQTGVGWMLVIADTQRAPNTADFRRRLINVFISGNDLYLIQNYQVILALDMWEHAYIQAGRPASSEFRDLYIQTFVSNINWDVVRYRYNQVNSGFATTPYQVPPGFDSQSFF